MCTTNLPLNEMCSLLLGNMTYNETKVLISFYFYYPLKL